LPISWKGALQQYVGRLHRLHDSKRFVPVYDYADICVPMLARMYESQLKGYCAMGYELIPPSASDAMFPTTFSNPSSCDRVAPFCTYASQAIHFISLFGMYGGDDGARTRNLCRDSGNVTH
jgi:superfamily II DNA or RNA helicase